MTVQELRIGNYVSVRTSHIASVCLIADKYIEVTTIESEFKNQEPGVYRSQEDAKHVEGIPLTEEWLIKFGFTFIDDFETLRFKMIGDNNHEILVDIAASVDDDKTVYSIGIYANEHWIFLEHIKHVHQLQNLYFALTGEELTYPSAS